MKLTVLGCWAPYPAPNQACSGYLLECGGRRLLIDLGHGSFSKLQKVCDFSMLDGVFISHLHPDHCADLSCLRHAVLGRIRQGESLRPPVFVPGEPEAHFEVLANFEDAFDVHAIRYLSPAFLKIGGIECQVFRTVHPIPTYGLVVEHQGKKFVYTSDTAWDDNLVELSKDADVLLCEASLLDSDSHLAAKGHLTSSQAGMLAARAGVRKLVLTHLWPGYNAEDLQREAVLSFNRECDFAEEYREYEC